jgi:DsbC/DsbD-like thiol-disulfide interchange protein
LKLAVARLVPITTNSMAPQQPRRYIGHMTVTLPPSRRAAMFAANLVFLLAIVRPALAADASPWDGGKQGAARLIAGATPQRAGVEIRLAPGWKTYWRYPGDSGVPPRFDFSGSLNVKSVTVRFPAPKRLPDESGITIGYKHDVVFPLDIVPEDAAKPVTLRLKLDYAVCEKICIPADAKGELTLGDPSAFVDRIDASAATVPKAVPLGTDGALSIRAARREGAKIVVDVAAPAGAEVELFAEGPTPDWALPIPARVSEAAGVQRFAFDLDGLPPDTKPDGATLTLTAVAGTQAIEVAFRLD